ncbi:MAG: hypothetical protein ACRDTD_09815 [Pseudonocardiaceae bacterium]
MGALANYRSLLLVQLAADEGLDGLVSVGVGVLLRRQLHEIRLPELAVTEARTLRPHAGVAVDELVTHPHVVLPRMSSADAAGVEGGCTALVSPAVPGPPATGIATTLRGWLGSPRGTWGRSSAVRSRRVLEALTIALRVSPAELTRPPIRQPTLSAPKRTRRCVVSRCRCRR